MQYLPFELKAVVSLAMHQRDDIAFGALNHAAAAI
jgi:hypothetical protein